VASDFHTPINHSFKFDTPNYNKMAPRDGDENRKPRHLAAQPVAPADGSDGEDEDDIVDDDIVDDDNDNDDSNDSEDDSEADMDSDEANEDEDPVQRDLRMQRLRTENAELVATQMEQDLMLKEINWKTEDIKAATMAKQEELAQLREARRLQEEAGANGGAGANPEENPDPSP
jgi:hypothetical protein